MRILVTGGFGYLGGRIAQSLSLRGHKVILASRKKQDLPSWLSNAEIVQVDWGDKKNLHIICEGVDVVIHSAGMNSQECALDPKGAAEFNGEVTSRLVKISKVVGVSKFIYLSTAHVYGTPLEGVINENGSLSNTHPYATSHVAGENAALDQDNPDEGFRSIVLRLSNGVGTPTHKNVNCWMLAINDFCRQVVEDGSIKINSPRNVQRDFVSISMISNIINMMVDSDKADGNIFNVTSAKNLSLQQIIGIIIERSEELFGFKPEVIFKNQEVNGKNSNFILSNAKLKKSFDFKNILEIEIDQLLQNCKSWFG